MEGMLFSNCSEAAYKVSNSVINQLSDEEKGIFLEIIENSSSHLDPLSDINLTKKAGSWSSNPYFENTDLDLFLDYFEIPSERTHWSNGTTFMNKEEYNKNMEEFCENCKKVEPRDLSSNNHTYERDVNKWKWLCKKCHRKIDWKELPRDILGRFCGGV